MGRYRGKFGFDEFTHEKAVLKRSFFGDSLAAYVLNFLKIFFIGHFLILKIVFIYFSSRYPPLTTEKLRSLHRLTGNRHKLPTFFNRFLPGVSFLLIGIIVGLFLRTTSNST